MVKLLIDTDIGDDVDDALAIAAAAYSSGVELVGITTMCMDVEKKARLARGVLAACGKKGVPVVAGCVQPLAREVELGEAPVLWDEQNPERFADLETPADKRHAVDFILDTVAAQPDVVILAIGPLTNIAAAVKKNPALMRPVPLYIMGGAFDSAYAEYNIAWDPEAADVVLRGMDSLRFFGLELSCQVWMEEEDRAALAASARPVARYIAQMGELHRQRTGMKFYLFDIFPLVGLLFPRQVQLHPRHMQVELEGRLTRGAIVMDCAYFNNSGAVPNAAYATMQDPGFIKRFFMDLVCG